MSEVADAHAHFFMPGYAQVLPENCRRVQPDEITLYEELARQHGIVQVLAIGYEGAPFGYGNNAYLAELARQKRWLRPVMYVPRASTLNSSTLQHWKRQRAVGISLYILEDSVAEELRHVPAEVWEWLTRNQWLLSVNSRGELWTAWVPVLDRYPRLRLLISHLGLPPAVAEAPDDVTATKRMAPILHLAQRPGPRVKLSGLYAIAQPSHAFPHRPAWPYVTALLHTFGPDRLLWGSDFSPSLEHVSFPQTLKFLEEISAFTTDELSSIRGGNLIRLLADVCGEQWSSG